MLAASEIDTAAWLASLSVGDTVLVRDVSALDQVGCALPVARLTRTQIVLKAPHDVTVPRFRRKDGYAVGAWSGYIVPATEATRAELRRLQKIARCRALTLSFDYAAATVEEVDQLIELFGAIATRIYDRRCRFPWATDVVCSTCGAARGVPCIENGGVTRYGAKLAHNARSQASTELRRAYESL